MVNYEKGEHGTKIRTKCQNPLTKDLTTLDFRKKHNVVFIVIVSVLGIVAVVFIIGIFINELYNFNKEVLFPEQEPITIKIDYGNNTPTYRGY